MDESSLQNEGFCELVDTRYVSTITLLDDSGVLVGVVMW